MQPYADESAIETPLVLAILILVAAPLIFFGLRYEAKVRAKTQAQAKRETTYQAALSSYSQIFKPGTKRKEVEDYFRSKKIEFQRQTTTPSLLVLYDLIPIGQDESTSWFCGKPDVSVKFAFSSSLPVEGRSDPIANDGDSLDFIEIFRLANCP